MRKIYLSIILFFVYSLCEAQRPHTGEWVTLNMHFNVSHKWQWHNDGSYRTLGTSFAPLQFLYRTGMRYNFNKRWNAAAGVAFFFSKTDFDKTHHEFGKEFRLWQEVNYQYSINDKWQLPVRLRVEQRFFEATSRKNEFTAHRFRLRSGIIRRLNSKWSIQLADEYMKQLAQKKISFDQNRLMFSAIYLINKDTQLQTGYLLLTWPDANQHIFQFGFTKIFSLHAK